MSNAFENSNTQLTVSNPGDLMKYLTKGKSAIEMALPKHLNPDRMMRLAITCFSTQPALRSCTAQSILASVVVASQLGLEIGVAGQGYLIPYKSTCTFVPGWQGLVSLLNNTGRATAWTGSVFEGDDFSFQLGSDPKIQHIPGENYGDPDKLIWVYACGKVNGSETPVIEAWPMSRVWKHRDRFNKVGQKHYSFQHPEMYARKVVLLQVLKYMPRSIELNNAITAADAAEIGHSTKVDNGVIVEIPAEDITKSPEITNPPDDGAKTPKDSAKEPAKEKTETQTAGAKTDSASPSNPPTPAEATDDPKKNIEILGKLLGDIQVDSERFIRWLKESKYITTPISDVNEIAVNSPKKLHFLITNWPKYKEAIAATK